MRRRIHVSYLSSTVSARTSKRHHHHHILWWFTLWLSLLLCSSKTDTKLPPWVCQRIQICFIQIHFRFIWDLGPSVLRERERERESACVCRARQETHLHLSILRKCSKLSPLPLPLYFRLIFCISFIFPPLFKSSHISNVGIIFFSMIFDHELVGSSTIATRNIFIYIHRNTFIYITWACRH